MGAVGQHHDQIHLRPQGQAATASIGSDLRLDLAIRADLHPLEPVDAGMDVLAAQAELGEREGEAVPRIGVRAPVVAGPVASGVGRRIGRPTEGVVGFGAVLQQAHHHPPHVREQQAAFAQIGVPLDLDRVGHVQPLHGIFGVEHQHGGAGVPGEVGEAQPRAAVQALGAVAPRPDRLLPEHVLGRHAHGQVAGLAGRQGGHGLDAGGALGAGVGLGALRIGGGGGAHAAPPAWAALPPRPWACSGGSRARVVTRRIWCTPRIRRSSSQSICRRSEGPCTSSTSRD